MSSKGETGGGPNGPAATHQILADRELWNRRATGQQDCVIAEIAALIAPAYSLIDTKRFACAGQAHRIATFLHVRTKMELHLIPGGTFTMGTRDPESELAYARRFHPHRHADFFELEAQRRMTAKPLLIGRFPVTCTQWSRRKRKLKNSNWKGGDFPVVDVSWQQCRDWLDAAGDGLRLPLSHEWEYATRAGAESRFFWGDSMEAEFCRDGSTSGGETHRVAEHMQNCNAFGLVDTLGTFPNGVKTGWKSGIPLTPKNTGCIAAGTRHWMQHAVVARASAPPAR